MKCEEACWREAVQYRLRASQRRWRGASAVKSCNGRMSSWRGMDANPQRRICKYVLNCITHFTTCGRYCSACNWWPCSLVCLHNPPVALWTLPRISTRAMTGVVRRGCMSTTYSMPSGSVSRRAGRDRLCAGRSPSGARARPQALPPPRRPKRTRSELPCHELFLARHVSGLCG